MTTATLSRSAVSLRPYQETILRNVEAGWEDYHALLQTAATGAGKTVVFLSLADRILQVPGARVLVLAHRKELVDQPFEKMETFYPDLLPLAGRVMAEYDECDRRLVVATVQTLASAERLRRLLAHGPITHTITDECHHAPADGYRRIYDRLRTEYAEWRHVGFTATPTRSDERALGEIYEKALPAFGIKELVQQRYLVPPRWLAIQTGISLAGVRTQAGDFVQGQLANVYETANCFELVKDSYQKYAAGRPAIAFVTSVKGAYELAETFNAAGIPAAASDGEASKRSRQNILSAFRAGEFKVLCNVGLWTEGLDVPEISCVLQVRPTKSDGLYVQMIGRGLRPVPGKEDALILDFAPVEARNVVMAGDVLGVSARKDAYLKPEAEPGEVIGGFTFDGAVKWLNGSPMELISRQLDYLNLSPWRWVRCDDGRQVLGLGEGSDGIERTLIMSAPAEQMTLWVIGREKASRDVRVFSRTGDLEALNDWATDYANAKGVVVLASKRARWQKEPPSDAQMNFARRLGCWQHGMSRGECADAITRTLALRALHEAGYAA